MFFFLIFCSLRSLTSFYIDAELSESENRLADPAFCEDEWMWTDMILGGGFQLSFLFSPLFALKWSNLIDIFSDGLKLLKPPSEWLKFFPSVHAHKCRRHFDHPLVTWSLGGEKIHGLARRPNLVIVWKWSSLFFCGGPLLTSVIHFYSVWQDPKYCSSPT